MYRVSIISGKVLAVKFYSLSREEENITELIESGSPVMLCDNLEDVTDILDIGFDEIEEV